MRYWHKHNILNMNFKKSKREPAIIWKRVNCQRITSKNTRPQWVDTWARDMARWYWSADTLFWQLSIDDNIEVQSASSWAPKVSRKCESKHWYACGADGRSVARSVGHVITKFSGMGRFIYPWCSAGALRARSSAIIKYLAGILAEMSIFLLFNLDRLELRSAYQSIQAV